MQVAELVSFVVLGVMLVGWLCFPADSRFNRK